MPRACCIDMSHTCLCCIEHFPHMFNVFVDSPIWICRLLDKVGYQDALQVIP